ncbi:MAG: protein jag [Spirochaetales bacterium]|jgi:spoIIIJ-associated protein|nr:protein jag [Spirochaetales bacterium]
MIKEFEGKTEKDAINLAVAELGLERDDFDVEIVEITKKAGLFRKGTVKIRVHTGDDEVSPAEASGPEEEKSLEASVDDLGGEKRLKDYLETLLSKMGLEGQVSVSFRGESKLTLDIESSHSNIIIGKKGKNLDALQLLLNVYAGRIDYPRRIVLDLENYRTRRMESLVKMAKKAADQVRRSGRSQLLEPMNPFERRLIHMALSEMSGVDTKSEGDGLYKQVRVFYSQEK